MDYNSNFKWHGSQVNCYNPGLKGRRFDFYRSCIINAQQFNIGEFAIVSKPVKRICRIMCMYHSHEKWDEKTPFRGTVRWYTWARDLQQMYLKQNIRSDEENEVVEDLREYDVFISLSDIQQKCYVIFASPDEPAHLIQRSQFDKETYFFCRYKISDVDITPIFSECENTKLSEDFIVAPSTPCRKLQVPQKLSSKKHTYKRKKPIQENILIVVDSNSQDEKTVVIRSPTSHDRNVKLRVTGENAQNLTSSTPNRKVSVKRNLNESFDSTPNSQSSTPVLNYSVLEHFIDGEESIKLKLKVSQKQNNPRVMLRQLKNDITESLSTKKLVVNSKEDLKLMIIDSEIQINPKVVLKQLKSDILESLSPKKTNKYDSAALDVVQDIVESNSKAQAGRSQQLSVVEVTPMRKSSRFTERKSYSEYASALKNTPTKRSRQKSTDSEQSVTDLLKKQSNSIRKTPAKRLTRNASHVTVMSPTYDDSPDRRERSISKPKKYCNSSNEFCVSQVQKKQPGNSKPKNKGRLQRNINKPKKYCITSDEISLEESPIKNHIKRVNVNKRTKQKNSKVKHYCNSSDEASSKEQNVDNTDEEEFHSAVSERNVVETSLRKRQIPGQQDVRKSAHVNVRFSDGHIIHKKCKSNDVENSNVMRTPKTNSNYSIAVSTPKSVLKNNTPSARAKLVREGLLTPSVQARVTPIKHKITPLNKAKRQLHVSYLPNALPCREKEFDDILNFLEGKLLDGCGGCMYVSGVPGTGKTATVTEVVKRLHSLVNSGDVPEFQYVSLNGMKLSEPRQSYVEILKQLAGKTVAWEQAQCILETKFTKPGKKSLPIVLVVDELDILCTKRQDVVYNLLDWPTKASVQLIVITIANTMDLPERLLMGRVTSRLGLTRLTFQAYTHKQLQEIVTKRLLGTDTFNPDAVQLVARKVASVSGDARRALDICRRAAEMAQLEGNKMLVSMDHVSKALNAMITQPKVQAISHCSRLQQLILQSVVAEVERTGVEETTFANVYIMLMSMAALDGFRMVSCTLALRAVSRLGACRLLLVDQKSNDIHQKLILNVSSDDVYYALKKD